MQKARATHRRLRISRRFEITFFEGQKFRTPDMAPIIPAISGDLFQECDENGDLFREPKRLALRLAWYEDSHYSFALS